jgi:hypothetical protein
MSITAIEIIAITRAISQGIVLIEDLRNLSKKEDITEEEANAIIRSNSERMQSLADND